MEQKLPVLASYKLAKLANKLNDQLKVIEEVRQGLIRKYGTPDEKGRGISVKQDSEGFEQFAAEFNELMEQEVEVIIEKVRLPEKVSSTCDSCKHVIDVPLMIEPNILMPLEEFIEVA